jgi:hypothetical protein
MQPSSPSPQLQGLSDLFSADDESTIVDAQRVAIRQFGKSLFSAPIIVFFVPLGFPAMASRVHPRSSTTHYIQMLHSFHLSRQQLSALVWATWTFVRERDVDYTGLD